MTTDERGLARIDKLVLAAHEIAASLRANKGMHQEHAALKAGISRRSYWEYLAGDGEAELAFQAIVLPAVHEQADENLQEAERAIGCTENGSGAWAGWHKWLMEKRYRKIYGDLASEVKIELTGKNGGPVQVETITREQALAELRELAKTDPAVAAVLQEHDGNDES